MSFLVSNRSIHPSRADSGLWFQLAVVYYGIANFQVNLNRSHFQNPFWLIYHHFDAGGEIVHESGVVTEMGTSELVVLPPWQTWQIISRRPLRHMYIAIDAPALSASVVRRHFFGARVMPEGHPWRELVQSMASLASEVEHQTMPSLVSACRVKSISYRVFEHLLLPLTEITPHPEPVRSVIEYIDKHLAGDCSLGRLANLAGFGVKKLNHAFNCAIGVSAVEYVRERRMSLAANLLLDQHLEFGTHR